MCVDKKSVRHDGCRDNTDSGDPQRFIRVHRSRIINIDYLDHAEPAGGGRLVARMTNGTAVQLSRTGSQALRLLVV